MTVNLLCGVNLRYLIWFYVVLPISPHDAIYRQGGMHESPVPPCARPSRISLAIVKHSLTLLTRAPQ